ncbi:protein RAFTIN 1B-like isoform X2 [Solanum tuberosum]|uniref:protein RAFTIN 1B-like isoform X2 n=1 Tax=Solanum tuberosum TaxID=4113 RepID=UPI00073A4A2B|nr:PREDICTED: protein RAFTIN 1B-like isoform X2 [Solanum tuberosum]
MDVKLGFCVLVSLVLLVAYGTEARDMAEGNSQSLTRLYVRYKYGGEEPKQNEHMTQGIFFLMDDLKLGKTLTHSFPTMDLPSSLQMLPKKVPFSLKEAKSMEETLRLCEDSPMKGETKYCATSIEAMRDFVQGILGENTQIEPLITMTTTSTDPLNHNRLQNYTILNDPEDVGATKMVACHTMRSVYYCHHTISKSKVLKVELRNDANGSDKIEAIAVCHLDTSDWNPSHLSFRVLGILPGTSPICHFFPSSNDLVWIPKSVAAL